MTTASQKWKSSEIQRQRRTTRRCNDWIYVAALHIAYEANLGTLLRTCDAVGACMIAPDTPHYRKALKKGNTLGRGKSCVHWVHKTGYLEAIKDEFRIVGVELAEDATRLGDLPMAQERTLLLLGHEHTGIPTTQWDLLDEVVEIPMVGTGHSLNVAVAGSLALYRLSGLI